MKNNKGFTLIELLAAISILAIISLIAVPSVINLTNKNKKSVYVTDAKRFISLVQYETRKNSSLKASLNSGISLDKINHSDVTTSPEGEEYSGYVSLKNNDYYVCLTDGKKSVKGSLTDLNSDKAIDYVVDGNVC